MFPTLLRILLLNTGHVTQKFDFLSQKRVQVNTFYTLAKFESVKANWRKVMTFIPDFVQIRLQTIQQS